MNNKIRRVLKTLKKQWKSADAQDLVEYALLLMLVALAIGATVKSFGTTVRNTFLGAAMSVAEMNFPANASNTAVVGAGLSGTAAVDNAAANVNAALAAAENQAAAAANAAAVAAAGGRNLASALSAAAAGNIAVAADLAAASGDTVAARDNALAAIDDAAAGLAAQFGINNGPIGSTALTAAANAETAGATGKAAVGTILGF